MTTTTSTRESADGSSSASDEGRRMAGVAKGEAADIAKEAKEHFAGLLDQAKDQANEQGSTQRDRIVQTLTTLGDDLDQMVDSADRPGMATDLALEAAGRVRALSDRLDGREPAQILDDVRAFARRRPGTFLLGALAAGLVAGRLTRGIRDGQSSAQVHAQRDSESTSTMPPPRSVAETTAHDTATPASAGVEDPGAPSAVRGGDPDSVLPTDAADLDRGSNVSPDRGTL